MLIRSFNLLLLIDKRKKKKIHSNNKNAVEKLSSPSASCWSSRQATIKSLVNLYQIMIIILFIKYELFNRQHVSAKAKALIYNKDGKFIYRPAKANQGHIIVIDDRHNSNENHKNDNDKQPEAAYHQVQLIAPGINFQPAAAASAAATSYYQTPATSPVQLISLPELPGQHHSSPAMASAGAFDRASGAYFQPPSVGGGAANRVAPAGSMVSSTVQVVPLIQLAYAGQSPGGEQQQQQQQHLRTRKLQAGPIVGYGTSYYPTQAMPPLITSNYHPISAQLASAVAAQQAAAAAAAAAAASASGATTNTLSLEPSQANMLQYAAFQQQQSQPNNFLTFPPQQLFNNYNNHAQMLLANPTARQSRNLDFDNNFNIDLSSLQASAAFQDEPIGLSQRGPNFYSNSMHRISAGKGDMVDSFDENQNIGPDFNHNQQHRQQQSNENNIFDDNPQGHHNNYNYDHNHNGNHHHHHHHQQQMNNNNNNSPARNGYQHHGRRHNSNNNNNKSSFDTTIPGFIAPPPPQYQHQHQNQHQHQHQQQQQNSEQQRNNQAQASGNNELDEQINSNNDGNYGPNSSELRYRTALPATAANEHQKAYSKFSKRIPQYQLNFHPTQNKSALGKQKFQDSLMRRPVPLEAQIRGVSQRLSGSSKSGGQELKSTLRDSKNQSKDSTYWRQFKDEYDIIS